jgi:hypothetical protein
LLDCDRHQVKNLICFCSRRRIIQWLCTDDVLSQIRFVSIINQFCYLYSFSLYTFLFVLFRCTLRSA